MSTSVFSHTHILSTIQSVRSNFCASARTLAPFVRHLFEFVVTFVDLLSGFSVKRFPDMLLFGLEGHHLTLTRNDQANL